jgi:hypothetical protein
MGWQSIAVLRVVGERAPVVLPAQYYTEVTGVNTYQKNNS